MASEAEKYLLGWMQAVRQMHSRQTLSHTT